MTIKGLFEHVGSSFETERQKDFKDNWLAKKIRNNAKDVFSDVVDENIYMIKGAPGEGRWATTPWFGIINREFSRTFQNGFYIVYLFSTDYQSVYLCLSQGVTDTYKDILGERDENISKVVSYWRDELDTYKNIFSIADITLLRSPGITGTPKKLIGDYEKVNICSKKYDVFNLPDDNTMIEDLNNMLLVYEELNSKLINNSYRNTIEYILTKKNIEDIVEEETTSYDFKTSKSDCLIETPIIELNYNIKSSDKVTHIDYEKKAMESNKVGYEGELFALEFEKKRLSENPLLKSYVEKIEHVSVSQGDGLGYDILSFELVPGSNDVRKRFIEVKATKSSSSTPFYISPNELIVSEEKLEQYCIYRVFNLYKEAKLYIVSGNMYENLNLVSSNYLAGPR